MNRQILASLLVLGVVGAAAGGATFAEFTDTESSEQNVFTAGALDLKVDWNESYNGEDIERVNLTDLDGEPIFEINDTKPGDFGEATISMHLQDNPGYIWMRLNVTSNDDVSTVEPELDAGDTQEVASDNFDGELANRILVDMWYDNGAGEEGVKGDNMRQPGEKDVFGSQTCEAVATDLAIAFDRSGSMDGPGSGDSASNPEKFQAAKDGGKILVNSLDSDDQGALVSFSDNATVDEPLTMDKMALNDSIDGLTSGGETNIGEAIQDSHEELRNGTDARNDANKVIVLLSNGNPNIGPDAFEEAEKAKNDGVRIITIAYGSDADEVALEEIATDGDAYVADESNVEDIFATIATEICAPQTLTSVSTALDEGVLLDADPSTTEADAFNNTETYHIGFAWNLPYETGNEIMTDQTQFDLDLNAVQERHNDDPTNPWITS